MDLVIGVGVCEGDFVGAEVGVIVEVEWGFGEGVGIGVDVG